MSRSRERRPATRKDTREGTAWLAVFTGLIFGYQLAFGWSGWMRLTAVAMAFASTAVLIFAAGFVQGMLRDTLPRRVPDGLAETHLRLERDGWRDTRVHPWWRCDEERSHVHMTHQDDGTLILVWDGTTVLDAAGNVIRHDP